MEVFTADNLVIVTSRFDFEAFEWRDYMARNWKRLRLVRKRSRYGVLYLPNQQLPKQCFGGGGGSSSCLCCNKFSKKI